MKGHIIDFDQDLCRIEVQVDEFAITLLRKSDGTLKKGAVANYACGNSRPPTRTHYREAYRVARGFLKAKGH